MSEAGMHIHWLILAFLLAAGAAHAESLVLNSGKQQVTLLECYTSQGCSSCPPADHAVCQITTP